MSAQNFSQLEAVLRYSVDPDEFINLYANLEFLQEHPAPAPIHLYRSLVLKWFEGEPIKAYALLQRIICLIAIHDDPVCKRYLAESRDSTTSFTYAAATVSLRAAGGKIRFSRKSFLSIAREYRKPAVAPKLRILHR
jgi:hypothetical protein